MIELILSHLSDQGMDFSNYPVALEKFFSYIVRTGLEDRIAFKDYYSTNKLPSGRKEPIEIYDPVNPSNNVASRYDPGDRDRLVDAAEEAADAISEAHYATTKGRALECWQIVMGPTLRF